MGTNQNDSSGWQHAEFFDIEDPKEFYKIIDRKRLSGELSAARPYVYWTMEVYDQANGIKGGGGLGVLAADTRRVAEQLEIPFVMITPFYRSELHQAVTDGGQTEWSKHVSPEEFGFNYIDDIVINTTDKGDVNLAIYQKVFGSSRMVTISEPNFGELYFGDSSGDHRLYQQVALGFGGYKALKMVGARPAVIQLNETSTIFAAIARLDELCHNGMNLYEAIVYVRKHTLYTNHTLVQAAESVFTSDQFRRFVMPNVKSPAVQHWLEQQFIDDKLRPSMLAIELTEAKNGVSKLHARVCDFKDSSGERVKFHAVTNGIDLQTWVLPDILKFYVDEGIVDKFGLVSDDYHERILRVTADQIRQLKRVARRKANELLAGRKDQHGEVFQIPEDAVVFDFKRRFADYKRPGMPFERIDELKSILEEYNAYYVFAGKVWQGDNKMYLRLQEILAQVSNDEFLRQRVYYMQDYDEALARALTFGADVAINVPIVGLEACGTSWEKDIANLKLLISTPDGGVADVSPLACLEVTGSNYDEEVNSLYANMRQAAASLRDDSQLERLVHKQLIGYLPVISGARMLKDYLKFLFDK